MLEIIVPPFEVFNEKTNEFINITSGGKIVIEHSLVSLSKWEAIYHKPFLSKEKKTPKEILEYIKCMTITQNVSDDIYKGIENNAIILKKIEKYIDDPMTATTFSSHGKSGSSARAKELLTSEVIYFLMFSYGIPIDCQKWHLNRLLTLIRVFSVKNEKQKPMSKKETSMHYAKLNAQRRKALNSKG